MTTSTTNTPVLALSSLSLIEIKGLRSYYGNDEDAINRHSTRHYAIHSNNKDTGHAICIDRVLDALPKYFTLYHIKYNSNLGLNLSSEQGITPQIKFDLIDNFSTWMEIESQLTNIVSLLPQVTLDSANSSHNLILKRSTSEQDCLHLYGHEAA